MPDTIQNTPDSLTLVLKEFGVSAAEKIILGSISLDIPDKEVTCLIGPSGTGKSTLLRTLAGHNSTNPNMHTWGSAIYCGAPLGESDRYPRLVMQSTRLLMSSLQENLIHDLPERSSLNIAQQRDLSARMLQEADIARYSDRLNKPVIELPLAIQRLVAIIRLCATGTRLLCLDEPTANLDEADSDLIIRYIQKQKNVELF